MGTNLWLYLKISRKVTWSIHRSFWICFEMWKSSRGENNVAANNWKACISKKTHLIGNG